MGAGVAAAALASATFSAAFSVAFGDSAGFEQAQSATAAVRQIVRRIGFLPLEGARRLTAMHRGRESRFLDELHRNRGRFAAADAQARDAALETLLLQRVDQRDEDARAARADRVAKRGRAAVHVDLVVRNADVAHRE